MANGRLCGRRFQTIYTQLGCDKTNTFCPGETDPAFYRLLRENRFPGYNHVDVTGMGEIVEAYLEPPGGRCINVRVRDDKGNNYLVKSYRILEDYNLEPLVLLYLRERKASDIAPEIVSYTEYGGYFTHLTTKWIEGTPIVWSFMEKALETLGKREVSLTEYAERVGRVLGRLHCVMSECTYDWCNPEPVSRDDVERWLLRISWRTGYMKDQDNPLSADVAEKIEDKISSIIRLEELSYGVKIRTHGDPHLYQFINGGGNIYLTDFEGEPDRVPASVLEKEPPVRDLAVLYRSLHYVAVTAYSIHRGLSIREAAFSLPEIMYEWIEANFEQVRKEYSKIIESCGGGLLSTPDEASLMFWSLERALYEFFYETLYGTGLEYIPLAWINHFVEQG